MRYFVVLVALFLYSCSPISRARMTKVFHATEERFKDHTGFVLYDPEKRKTIFDYQGGRYFTPASNTKIFTLYTSLKILGDSVPALEYILRNDSLIFWGTGDPSFLYRRVHHDSTAYRFLSANESELFFSQSNYHTTHFGEGWAWDDYNSQYSPERSSFPMFGNLVTVAVNRELLRVSPPYFTSAFVAGEPRGQPTIVRDLHGNRFVVHAAQNAAPLREINIPFRLDSLTLEGLMAATLNRYVRPVNVVKPANTNTIFSIHSDSLYRVMMQDSDNFIAEQLLLMCANALSDSLKPEIAIDFMKRTHLRDLPDEPVWVDGSGLSRYNLFTPRSIVRLWEKIAETVPRERLFSILATGGVNGTLRNWYRAESPYIFGKTGSLSNNHCLSGFLVTKKGKVLIFSFMNSNFTESGSAIRRNMEGILRDIHDNY